MNSFESEIVEISWVAKQDDEGYNIIEYITPETSGNATRNPKRQGIDRDNRNTLTPIEMLSTALFRARLNKINTFYLLLQVNNKHFTVSIDKDDLFILLHSLIDSREDI